MADVTLEEVQHLVIARVARVLGVADDVDLDARFADDLHADSLDLVEIVERVERDLAERGVTVDLADEQLLAMATVRDAAVLIHAAAGRGSA